MRHTNLFFILHIAHNLNGLEMWNTNSFVILHLARNANCFEKCNINLFDIVQVVCNLNCLSMWNTIHLLFMHSHNPNHFKMRNTNSFVYNVTIVPSQQCDEGGYHIVNIVNKWIGVRAF